MIIKYMRQFQFFQYNIANFLNVIKLKLLTLNKYILIVK